MLGNDQLGAPDIRSLRYRSSRTSPAETSCNAFQDFPGSVPSQAHQYRDRRNNSNPNHRGSLDECFAFWGEPNDCSRRFTSRYEVLRGPGVSATTTSKRKSEKGRRAFPHSYWSSYARSPRRSNVRVLAETIRRHYVRIQKGIVIRFLLHAPASRLAGSKPKSSRPSEALEKQWIWIWKRGSVKGHFPVQMVTNQPFWSRPCPAKLFDSNGHVFSNPTGPTMFSHLRRCDRDSLAHIAILTTSKCASRMSAVMTSL